MSRGPSRIVRWGLVLLALPLAVPLVRACQLKDDPMVRVSVVAILASEKDPATDKKLEGIAREVRKVNNKLKGFRLKSLSCRSVPIGRAVSFDLVEEQKADITVQKGADEENRIRLKVGPPKMGDITYSTPCGKFLPIVTRFRTKANELLIIAVRVQPCHGK